MAENQVEGGYVKLRSEIAGILAAGRERASRAVDREQLQTYHQVGRILQEHIQPRRERAAYGGQVISRLAIDLGVARQRLYEMLKLYRLFPIVHARGQLGWGHYRALLAVPDEATREELLADSEANGWTTRELVARTRREEGEKKDMGPAPAAVLPALRGRLSTYRVIDGPRGPRLDLGFGIRLEVMPGALDDVPVGTIVEALPEGPGFPMLQGCQFRPAEGKAASYYTYAGIVEHVVDGDTLWVDIECGFGIWTEQKLRLRGIDAPEMDTAEGREAKDFVVRAIGRGRSSIAPKGASTSFKATVGRAGGRGQMEVAVTTTRPDKYDRYLVDVFYDERLTGEAQDGRGGDAGSRAAEVLRTGAFLNRRLVEEGFASRYRGKVPG